MPFFFQRLALILFGLYLAVFPGSTLTVAFDLVPPWGSWMGGALLMLQGAAVLCWLIGEYGRRGALAGLLVFLIAWAVEHAGVTTGFPFGRYHYTEMLQPQLFGVVPLAIAGAWLMVAIGAWQLATTDDRRPTTDGLFEDRGWRIEDRVSSPLTLRSSIFNPLSWVVGGRWSVVRMATLVLLLDLQIETVATTINRYWVWLDHGPYYGVPTANFAAWWLVGLVMGLIVSRVLPMRFYVLRFTFYLPTYLYILSTLMFTTINLARGYTAAGLVGVAVLLVIGIISSRFLVCGQKSGRSRISG